MDEDFMRSFRWITPLVVSITAILVSILIAVVNNLTSEIRAVRIEVAESRKFAVQYTDKMIELVIKTSERKK
jgi:hypothetical protein